MDIAELYQSLILDHNRSPRNNGELAGANRVADGRNPMCGDQLRVWLKVEDDRIADVAFLGKGCAISQASASLMTTSVKGKTRAEAEQIFARFHDLVTGKPLDEPSRAALGKLAAFGGVSRCPARVKCASLSWHAMRAALNGSDSGVSTE
jgi:nitrogen fixation NifU-like protein